MKHRPKVPLYHINLDIRSNEARNAEHQEQSNMSPQGNGIDADSSEGMKFKASTSSLNQNADSAHRAVDPLNSEMRVRKSEVRDQDTDPKHMEQNKSEQLEENNSNFSLDSIPSENNQNDDEKDEKLRGHTTGRLPTRTVGANRVSGPSNYRWSRQSQGHLNGENNSSNYLHTMECYQDSEDMDLTLAQGDHGNYANQIMLTEGFPSTELVGVRANSLIEMKLKRDSFEQGEQHTYLKGSQIRNPREYLVKKSQINLIAEQDYPLASNTRTQKYPTMFKYLCNLNKGGGNLSALSEKKSKKAFKSRAAAGGTQPLKNCSPSRYTNLESSFQRSSRRKAGQMISQITLVDDETQKVVTDDEQDQPAELPSAKGKMNSKASDCNLVKSPAIQQNDSSYRNSDSKQAADEISIRVSKIIPSESIKERAAANEQRTSVLKEEDALNDTIDEIRALNKSSKPKTHRSKCSSEFKKSMKMQPSQIIKKSNVQNKTPVMILKIDIQRNQKPQIVSQTTVADQSQNGSQSPMRRELKSEKQQQHSAKREGLRISTEAIAQSAKKMSHKRSHEKKFSRDHIDAKKLQIDHANRSDAKTDCYQPEQHDNNYQLDVNFERLQNQMGPSAIFKKSQSKENLRINIQKIKESQSMEKTGKHLDRKEAIKSAEPPLQLDMNSFKNKKKSECIQYTEKRDIRIYEKKCLFTTTGLQRSEKKIRQNNSCQNIHSHSNYLQGNKIIQDVQRIKQINLNSSRHHKIQKSSLERIVGSNECLKLFDTIEKIKKTPNFHVKNLSMRKQSDQSNNKARGVHQRAMTSRQNTDGPVVDERSPGGAQNARHEDYNPLDAKDLGMNSKQTKRFNLTKASYLNINRKKSQSPCAIQKAKKNLFIFSSEEVNVPRRSPIDKLGKSKLNDLCNANHQMSSQRGASANVARQSGSRQPSKDNIFNSTTIKRVNVRISSQQSQNQSGLNLDLQKEKEHQSLEKRIGERTQSLKQFIIQQKKELFKARKQQSIVDEDEIKIGERTSARAERHDLMSSNHDRASQNQELQDYQPVNEVKAAKEFNKMQVRHKAPLSPQKKSSGRKTNEKRGSPQKRVVQIDLHQDFQFRKQTSRNSMKDGRQILKASQTSVLASRRQAADPPEGPYQDLVPITKEDKLSKSSSMSNMIGEKKHPEPFPKMTGHILVDEEDQQEESQDEDPIDQAASGMLKDSEVSTSQADNAASTSQADVTGRHSDIERQVHQKIRQILKEYRDAIDNQENEKLQKILKNSPGIMQPDVRAQLPSEPLLLKRFMSQESLEDQSLRTSLPKEQSNLFGLKRKTTANIQTNGTQTAKTKITNPPNKNRPTEKKERRTWRKQASAIEELPLQRTNQKMKEDREQIEQAIDLRNQIELTSSSPRKSMVGSGQQINPRTTMSEALDYPEDSGNNKERLSTIEFFLTQSNGGFGTAGGLGSKILLKQSSGTDQADTVLKSDDFSTDGMKSPGSNIGERQLIELKQQLDKIAQAIDTGEEGDREMDNLDQNPKKLGGNTEKILKRKRKKDRAKQMSLQDHVPQGDHPFAARPNQQYGYFLNPNDGQVSLVPISQIHQQQTSTQQFHSQQASNNGGDASLAQSAHPKPLEASTVLPPNVAMSFPGAQSPYQLQNQPQQHQIVWMPVPITHMTPYSQGMPPTTLQPQLLATPAHPLTPLNNLQTAINMPGQQFMHQNPIQIQPFVAGPPSMVSAPPITPTLPPGTVHSPLGMGGATPSQQSAFAALEAQQLQNSQIVNQQLMVDEVRAYGGAHHHEQTAQQSAKSYHSNPGSSRRSRRV